MNHQIQTYLSVLNVSKAVQNRVRQIHDFCNEACPEEITDIFITEYVTEEGLREYENLWFFSNNFVMEAKSFLSVDSFDLVRLRDVGRWEVKGENYDYKHATPKSRLNVEVRLHDGGPFFMRFKASQENCDYLMTIVHERLTPNVT